MKKTSNILSMLFSITFLSAVAIAEQEEHNVVLVLTRDSKPISLVEEGWNISLAAGKGDSGFQHQIYFTRKENCATIRTKESAPFKLRISRNSNYCENGRTNETRIWELQIDRLSEKGIKLEFDLSGAMRTGKVVSESGKLPSPVCVIARLNRGTVLATGTNCLAFVVSAETDDEGNYRLTDLLPGEYELEALPSAGSSLANDGLFLVDKTGQKWLFGGATPATIEHSVADELPAVRIHTVDYPVEIRVSRQGEPVSGVKASAVYEVKSEGMSDFAVPFSAMTNEEGRIVFMTLRIPGKIRGLELCKESFGTIFLPEPIDTPKESNTYSLCLQIPEKLGEIRGSVPDFRSLPGSHDGLPVNWKLRLLPEPPGEGASFQPDSFYSTREIPAAENFLLDNLLPGSYLISLHGVLSGSNKEVDGMAREELEWKMFEKYGRTASVSLRVGEAVNVTLNAQ